MKSFSPEYTNHITSGETTLCFCWLITRSDGVSFGFTDHDCVISFGGNTFDPASGMDGAEQVSTLGGQTDTGEVLGVLTSDSISEDDIAQGKFDGAQVKTYRVNWREPSVRTEQRTDTIGEIKREDGIFQAELRSPQEQLNVTKGGRYSPLCDAQLGDARCGVDAEIPAHKVSTNVFERIGRHMVVISSAEGFEADWFSHGTALWTSGKRAGVTDRITKHQIRDGLHVLSFAQPAGDWGEVGDELTLRVGCDRTFSTCRKKFANVLNFRGFPHIPGNDAVLRFPHKSDNYSGRPHVK